MVAPYIAMTTVCTGIFLHSGNANLPKLSSLLYHREIYSSVRPSLSTEYLHHNTLDAYAKAFPLNTMMQHHLMLASSSWTFSLVLTALEFLLDGCEFLHGGIDGSEGGADAILGARQVFVAHDGIIEDEAEVERVSLRGDLGAREAAPARVLDGIAVVCRVGANEAREVFLFQRVLLPEIPEFPIFPHITKFLGACLNAFM